MLKLYEVTNGFIGESELRCLVVAASEKRALELAKERYEACPEGKPHLGFLEDLRAEVLCGDLTQEWVGDVTDG